MNTVLTVGHSNHSLEAFLGLLSRHGVTVLADVRSKPYSRFNPQFNREAVAAALRDREIAYVFLGRELGGRPDDPAVRENGRVAYGRVRETGSFRAGIERVSREAETHVVAAMCAEREPLDCHRTLLVAPALDERGVEVAHIHPDRAPEPHAEAMDRLVDTLGLAGDMFLAGWSRDALVAHAVALRAGQAAHAVPDRRRGGA